MLIKILQAGYTTNVSKDITTLHNWQCLTQHLNTNLKVPAKENTISLTTTAVKQELYWWLHLYKISQQDASELSL